MLHSYCALVFLVKAQIYRNFKRNRVCLARFYKNRPVDLRFITFTVHTQHAEALLSIKRLPEGHGQLHVLYQGNKASSISVSLQAVSHTRTHAHARAHTHTEEVTAFCSSPAGHCGVEISLWAVSNREPPSVPSQVTNENASRVIYLVIRHVEKARRWWMAACPYITQRKRRQLRRFAF